MKIILLILSFVTAALAQEPRFVRFASGGENRLNPQDLSDKLQSLESQGVHRLDLWKHLDEGNTDSSVSGVAIGLKGPLVACAAEVAKHGTSDPFKTVSWYWADAPKNVPATICFRIKSDGLAIMDIIQNGQVVGAGRARTNANRAEQPKPGTYRASKQSEKAATSKCGVPARLSYQTTEKLTKKNGKYSPIYMIYPIHIYGGFFAHGGNNSGESGGCMRVNELYQVEYTNFNVTRVVIEHL